MVYSGLAFAWVLMHVSILCMYSKWSTGRQPDNQRQDDTLLLLNDQSGLVLGDSTIFSWAGCHKNDDARLLTLSCACTKRTTKFYVCHAFCAGARQSFMFFVRFLYARGKVSEKIWILCFFLFVHCKYIILPYIFEFGTHLDLFVIFNEITSLKGIFLVKSNLNYKCKTL
jgi:hypothetical protein